MVKVTASDKRSSLLRRGINSDHTSYIVPKAWDDILQTLRLLSLGSLSKQNRLF
jgi:hypothetical protein